MTDSDRHPCYTQPLTHPGQQLVIEYVRAASWDRHWAVVLHGLLRRTELHRLASYTEARRLVDRHLPAPRKDTP